MNLTNRCQLNKPRLLPPRLLAVVFINLINLLVDLIQGDALSVVNNLLDILVEWPSPTPYCQVLTHKYPESNS